MSTQWKNWTLLTIGTAILCIGIFFYSSCRFEVPYIIIWLSQRSAIEGLCIYQNLNDSFPSFVHVLGFSTITAAFIDRKIKYIVYCVISWLLINVIFEFFQAKTLSIIKAEGSSLIEVLEKGTFDSHDILASLFGAIVAFLIIFLFLDSTIRQEK